MKLGGKFTMNYKEAADFINISKPKKVIPTHYGSIIGDKNLGTYFSKLINSEINLQF